MPTTPKKKVLVISHDKVGPSMAGPGMRYHQISLILSKNFDVTLAVFNPKYIENLADVTYEYKDIHVQKYQDEFRKFDTIFALWLSPEMIRFCKQTGIRVVMDLYAPGPVEELVSSFFAGRTSHVDDLNYTSLIETQRFFFRSADFIVCSNPIQKDMWTGFAFASNALLPSNYSTFTPEKRIGLLPMGINKDELSWIDGSDPIRKQIKGLGKKDFIIVWTGGIWDWFDAETPIKAMNELKKLGKENIKLIFLGTRHPNSDVPEMSETKRAHTIAEKYDLKDRTVFFLEGWLPYAERLNYLSKADAALYAHKPSIEARYSHRTRVLDHLLVGLPTLATTGDYLADVVDQDQLGICVPPCDHLSLSKAIVRLAENKELYKKIKDNILAISNDYTWEKTTTELVNFIKSDTSTTPIVQEPKTNITNRPSYQRYIARILPRGIKEKIKEYI